MKLIIKWQSTKDITEALIQMNDEAGKKAYYALENIRRNVVIFLFIVEIHLDG